jgi:ornithine cyclodeaminase/alanine dehydrogenase
MAVGDVLWLSRSDVDAVAVTPNQCIDLVRKAMEWQAEGSLEVPAKIGIHPPKGRHINAMPAFIGPSGAAGLKWVADLPANRKYGLRTIHGLIILNDPDNGSPFCIMEALSLLRNEPAMTVCRSGVGTAECNGGAQL